MLLIIGIYHDARTFDIDQSNLPVNEQLAITISQRYLAGYWTHPVKLHLTPYEMKNMKETPETYVVDIIDERDTPFCKGYQVVVEKDNGKVAFNSIGWCKRREIEKNALFLEENLARLKNFLQ